jgi:hypothetical protein
VRGVGACRAVSGCLRSGADLVDIHLDVVPLPPRSSSQTVAGCLLGEYVCVLLLQDLLQSCSRGGRSILLDVIGGLEIVLWKGGYPALTLTQTCGSNQAS